MRRVYRVTAKIHGKAVKVTTRLANGKRTDKLPTRQKNQYVKRARQAGIRTVTRAVVAFRWQVYVDGDTDCNIALLNALGKVGRDLGKTVHIASGNRTYAEQAELYAKFLNGSGNLAARPGTSNHEGGNAADAAIDGVNIGDYPGARVAMRKHGLCLPVRGEAWHCELGSRWAA